MTSDSLVALSNEMADAVAAVAPAVVPVHGRRRPASGLVYQEDVILTAVRVLGREDGLVVRRHDGRTFDATLAGWDPTTSLAVLRVTGLETSPARVAGAPARVGQLALALARSWSNAVTASAGIVSVIGGPMPTGRRRAIDQVIRTSAPMHDGFAGGAFVDPTGELLGVTTGTSIRGLGVVIPAGIAWSAAASVLQQGGVRRGYLGVSGQAVHLAEPQRVAAGRAEGLLVGSVGADSPALAAGILVGDVLLDFDGHPVGSPEDLLDLLQGHTPDRDVAIRILRGDRALDLKVRVGERPTP
jgi:S1-C subfamily serine protease